MKFRTAQIVLLLVVFLVTVAVVGVTSYVHASFAVRDLSRQVLAQTADRIDQRVQRALDIALAQGRLNRRLMEEGRLSPDDQNAQVAYFLRAMRANPQLSFLSFSRAVNGHYAHVKRDERGRLSARIVRVRSDGKRRGDELDVTPKGLRLRAVMPTPYDPRNRPFFLAAQAAKTDVWTESYVFVGQGGKAEVPGVTRANVVMDNKGTLLGVLTADFDLRALSGFLRPLRVGNKGFAFVLELRKSAPRRAVIAHPSPRQLTRPVSQGRYAGGHELVPAESLEDPRVVAFLKHVPSRLRRGAGPSDDRLRPVRFRANGVEYIGGFRRLSGKHGLDWLICIVLPEADVMGRITRMQRITLAVGAIGVLVALLLGVLLSRRMTATMRELVTETEAVGQFELDPKPVLNSRVEELNRLAVSIEDMKAGLRSFRKFVPADLVRSLLSSGEEAALGGEHREITILFSDIIGFTTIAEHLPADKLVELLSDCLSSVSDVIEGHDGTVDKFIGDAVMAFWGAPLRNYAHALSGCRAALACQARLAEMRPRWRKRGLPELHCRIGLNSGATVVGNIGSATRLEYTAVGDAVNLASRLESLNKLYGTQILISEATYESVAKEVVVRPLDRVSVTGRQRGSLIYELLGLSGEVTEAERQAASDHAAALELYLDGHFADAGAAFAALLAQRPDDQAEELLLQRCRQYQAAPPQDWDGVYQVQSK